MVGSNNGFQLDFVGIGAPKCATTWIYECLKEHPQIYMTAKDQGRTSFFTATDPSKKINNYEPLFQNQNKIKGNFSVQYFTKNNVVQRIKNHNPQVKIIASVRNPVQRAYSQYLHASSLGNKNWNNFTDSIEKAPRSIIEPGFYYKHLKRYFEIFPEKNILVLIYRNIRRSPPELIQKVYRFLNVDPSFVPPSISQRAGVTKFKLTKLGKLTHGRITRFLRQNKWGRRIHQSPFIRRHFYRFVEFYVRNKNPVPPMKEETRRYLKELYREDIENLEELIGRDLSFWK